VGWFRISNQTNFSFTFLKSLVLTAGFNIFVLKLWESKLAISPAVGSQQQFAHQYGVNYADPNTFNAAALMLPSTNPLLLMVNSLSLLVCQQRQAISRTISFYQLYAWRDQIENMRSKLVDIVL
jgi:hypothetical protein